MLLDHSDARHDAKSIEKQISAFGPTKTLQPGTSPGPPPRFLGFMSVASLQNGWLEGHKHVVQGRASAKSALIARHNFKGEAVFQARRSWHASRAYADAAHRRLAAAMAELEAAKRGEEDAERTPRL